MDWPPIFFIISPKSPLIAVFPTSFPLQAMLVWTPVPLLPRFVNSFRNYVGAPMVPHTHARAGLKVAHDEWERPVPWGRQVNAPTITVQPQGSFCLDLACV